MKSVKDVFKISIGIILVIIGVIGGLIPIFQGWIFGVPGLLILSNYFHPIKRLLVWGKAKMKNSKDPNKESSV